MLLKLSICRLAASSSRVELNRSHISCSAVRRRRATSLLRSASSLRSFCSVTAARAILASASLVSRLAASSRAKSVRSTDSSANARDSDARASSASCTCRSRSRSDATSLPCTWSSVEACPRVCWTCMEAAPSRSATSLSASSSSCCLRACVPAGGWPLPLLSCPPAVTTSN